MDLLQEVRRRRGAARVDDLRLDDPARAALGRLVRRGELVRPGRGVVAVRDAPVPVVTARRVGGRVTCVSLVRQLGLPLLAPDDGAVHVAVRPQVATPRWAEGAVLLHRTTGLEVDGVTAAAPIALALRHAVGCLPVRDAVAVVDAALRLGLAGRGGLTAARPRAHVLRFDRVLAAADGRSESLPETFLRLELRARGIPYVVQPVIPGVGRGDLLVDDQVLVEVDGYAYHSDRRAFGEDRRRDRAAALAGFGTMRFTYHDAVERTAQSVDEIVAVCERRRGSAA